MRHCGPPTLGRWSINKAQTRPLNNNREVRELGIYQEFGITPIINVSSMVYVLVVSQSQLMYRETLAVFTKTAHISVSPEYFLSLCLPNLREAVTVASRYHLPVLVDVAIELPPKRNL